MDIKELKKRKKDLKLSYDDIATKSGIPKTTITNILTGRTSNPRIDTLRAIEKTLGIGGWTEEDEKKGAVPYVVRNLTGDEDELLDLYREIGNMKGPRAQAILIKLAEEMLNL